jgi:hypothetical protein
VTDEVARFYIVKPVVVCMALLSVGMSALAFALAAGLMFNRQPNAIDTVLLWICGAFFLPAVPLWLSQLWIRGPAIEISREGIRDQRFSSGTISWDVIEKVRSGTIRWNDFIMLHLRPGAQGKFARSVWRTYFDACNALIGWRGVYMTMAGTTGVMEDVLAAIDRIAPARLARPPAERPPAASPEPPNPADASYCLRHPPNDAEVKDYRGRRVVVLKDGRVAAETLAGDGRWFKSFDEFRNFIE